MKPFHVFVEGPADKAFIEALLVSIGFGGNIEERVTAFKGWTALVNSEVRRRLDDGDVVLIVFDADDPTKEDGGFLNRLNAIRKRLGTDLVDRVHIFLFPDSRSDGDLETLLERIVRSEHRSVIDECWAGYVSCLASKAGAYNPPTTKSKMQQYAAAIDADVWKDQGFNKTFTTDVVWDWSSSSLEPLKVFLRENLDDKQNVAETAD